MNYEICKKLKDAGFLQDSWERQPSGFLKKSIEHYTGEIPQEDFAYSPTLSELIEACGDKFGALYLLPEREILDKDQKWSADPNWDKCSADTKVGWGKTPEEAVANLWLELNKKQ